MLQGGVPQGMLPLLLALALPLLLALALSPPLPPSSLALLPRP